MKDSLHSYIAPGIIHFMLYPETLKGRGPILKTLEKIVEDDFFAAVEVGWIKDDQVRKEARDLLDASGLSVYYAAQPRLLTQNLDLNSSDQNEREKAVATLKEGVDEACELNARALAFLSGKNVEDEQKEEAMDLLVDSISSLCTYARKADPNLNIVLEVFDSSIDKCALIGPAQSAQKVADRVASEHDNFGLMVDLSHLPLLGETPREAILPISEHLVHIHIGNAVLDKEHSAYGDSHPRFGLNSGENGPEEVAEFLEVLLDIGYLSSGERKVVSFEVQPVMGEEPEVMVANAKRTLREAWALV